MSWSPVRVRAATGDDLPALIALGKQLTEQATGVEPQGVRSRAAAEQLLEARYRDAIADPDRHLVLAVEGDPERVLGMALLTVTTANPLLEVRAVQMTHSVVAAKYRKRGAGRALVTAAVALAEEHGLEQLVVSLDPGSRDAARYFARLGFAPLVVRRAASVSVVRRRLAFVERPDEPALRRRPLRQVPSRRAASRRSASLDSGL